MAEVKILTGPLAQMPEEIVEGTIFVATDDNAVYVDGAGKRVRISHFPTSAYKVDEYQTFKDDFKMLGTYSGGTDNSESLYRVQLPTFLSDESRQAILKSIYQHDLSGELSVTFAQGTSDMANAVGTNNIVYVSNKLLLEQGNSYFISLNSEKYIFKIAVYNTNNQLQRYSRWNFLEGFVGPLTEDSKIQIIATTKPNTSMGGVGPEDLQLWTKVFKNGPEIDDKLNTRNAAGDAKIIGRQIAALQSQINALAAIIANSSNDTSTEIGRLTLLENLGLGVTDGHITATVAGDENTNLVQNAVLLNSTGEAIKNAIEELHTRQEDFFSLAESLNKQLLSIGGRSVFVNDEMLYILSPVNQEAGAASMFVNNSQLIFKRHNGS